MSNEFDVMVKMFEKAGIDNAEMKQMFEIAGVDIDNFDASDYEAGHEAGLKMGQAIQEGLFSETQKQKLLNAMLGGMEEFGEVVYESEMIDGELVEYEYQNGQKIQINPKS